MEKPGISSLIKRLSPECFRKQPFIPLIIWLFLAITHTSSAKSVVDNSPSEDFIFSGLEATSFSNEKANGSMSDAMFAYDGNDGLILDQFTNLSGTTDLFITDDGNNFIFTLNAGLWAPSLGHVNNVGIVASANVLTVDKSLFAGAGKTLDWTILDNNSINLNVSFTSTANLPLSENTGLFSIDVGGSVVVNAPLNSSGSLLKFRAINQITVNQAITTGGTGGLLLVSTTKDLVIGGNLFGGAGHISLRAGDDVYINNSIFVDGAGDIHISSSNNTSDAILPKIDGVNVDATVQTLLGNINILSDNHIRITAAVSAPGANPIGNNGIGLLAFNELFQLSDIISSAGVLAFASSHLHMSNSARTFGNNILYRSNSGNLELGLLEANNNVSLSASLNVIDGNGTNELNISAINARLLSGNMIGEGNPGVPGSLNPNALDLDVENIAAISLNGIYLLETDEITVGHSPSLGLVVSTMSLMFNNVTTPFNQDGFLGGIEDLTVVGPGQIELVSKAGSINITDGGDGDNLGVGTANGHVLIESRETQPGVYGDVMINSRLVANSGTATIKGKTTTAPGVSNLHSVAISSDFKGTLAPGGANNPGQLNIQGNFIHLPNDIYEIEFLDQDPGSGYDQVSATGLITIQNTLLALYKLGGFVPTPGASYIIVDNKGADAIQGTYLGLPEGSTISNNFFGSGLKAVISYVGGDGNDIVIEMGLPVPVPALSDWALIVLCLFFIIFATVKLRQATIVIDKKS